MGMTTVLSAVIVMSALPVVIWTNVEETDMENVKNVDTETVMNLEQVCQW